MVQCDRCEHPQHRGRECACGCRFGALLKQTPHCAALFDSLDDLLETLATDVDAWRFETDPSAVLETVRRELTMYAGEAQRLVEGSPPKASKGRE